MKKLSSLVFAALMIGSLSSCGNNQNDDFTPLLDRNRECIITINGDYSNFDSLQTQINGFRKYYGNVKIEYTKLSNYFTDIVNRLESSEKPNIFFATSAMLNDEKYATVVAHMENLMDPSLNLNLDCIRSGLINRKYTDKLLIVPIFARTYGMLVNEDLFKKEELEIPQKWSELLSVCASFKEKKYQSPMMGYTAGTDNCFMNTVAYPTFVIDIANNQTALDYANNKDERAGEYMRDALLKVVTLINNECINMELCKDIGDNYGKVISKFFDGDVPMMIGTAVTASGTKSREKDSKPFQANPFKYSFHPIPLNEQGSYFIDSPALEFAVNKDAENLDMTNEFMRYLLRPQQLKATAREKGLLHVVKDVQDNPMYEAFNNIPVEHIYSPEVIGISDDLAVQIKMASYYVGKGTYDIDAAIANYGQFVDAKK